MLTRLTRSGVYVSRKFTVRIAQFSSIYAPFCEQAKARPSQVVVDPERKADQDLGADVVGHRSYIGVRMAEVAFPKNLFAEFWRPIAELAPQLMSTA